MVKACKLFIMDQSSDRIWNMERQPLIEKLNHCCNLYKMYQGKFHEIKQKIEENPEEKPFEFSEMYIFGKFEAFCKRLERVMLKKKVLNSRY